MRAAARERLLDMILVELAEKGRERIVLTDVLVLAGISETDFEAEFPDEEACLFAAYRRLTEHLRDLAAQSCTVAAEWPARVRLGLEALLTELATRPPVARALTHAFPAIGPDAHACYRRFVEGLAPLLSEGRSFSGMRDLLPAEVELLAVGAAEAIVVEEIEAERAAQLPAMVPAILFSVLVPFLGPEAAGAAMREARPAAR